MQGVKCRYNNTFSIEKAYDTYDFPFDKLKAKARGKYIELPVTFDIETSNIYDKETDKHFAFAYHFQWCVEGYVCFGRKWEDFSYFMNRLIEHYHLDNDKKLVVYVHNLAFEFQFMHNFLELNEVFATDKRKVLTCKSNEFEFRCSYRLSNMSLEKFIENTENTIHFKSKDDLDYYKIRTYKTELSMIELGYCYNDVKGLYECIIELLKNDTLESIPLTSTGYVRRDCRNAMRKNKQNRKNFIKTKLDIDQYILLKECFRGGNTASNRYHTNMIIDNVNSYDISSSYPFVMMTEDFPIGKFMYYSIASLEELKLMNDRYCTIGRYIFEDLKLKKRVPFPYIPLAKCTNIQFDKERKEFSVYNGRVMECEFLSISLTNYDFDIISQQYDFKAIYVNDFYFSRRGKLPLELRQVIMNYFDLKTTLKGIKEKEYEYIKSKNKLNSIYGMTVTDIIHKEITFTNGEFTENENDDPESSIEKYYQNRNNFLPYQWGVFVTAHARRRLQQAIDKIGLDCIYTDTDSIKFIGNYDHIFNKINDEIVSKDFDITPCSYYNNREVFMGVWDKENSYKQFITMGAKKYAYIYQNDKLGITVSGLNKKQGAEELKEKGGLSRFQLGEIFYKSGRTTAYFNDDIDIYTITVNNCTFTTSSNVAIVDTTYTLGITDTMLSIIETLKGDQ